MSKIVLTADQVYALAHILKANYLDYYYISLSGRDNNPLWLGEITKELVSKGILTEDFSGDTTIDPEVEDLIKPLYFGSKESSLDINIFGNQENHEGYRFHFLDDKVTMTKLCEEGLEIKNVETEEIKKLTSSLLSSNYSAESSKVDIKFDTSKVSRIFIVKNAEVEVKNNVTTFVENDGVIYEEDTNDNIYSVSGADFADKLYKILAEV